MAKFETLKFIQECAKQALICAKETSRKLSASVENINDPTQRLTSLGPRHVCQDLIFAARTCERKTVIRRCKGQKVTALDGWGKVKWRRPSCYGISYVSLPGNTTTSIVLLSFEKGPPFYPQGRLQCKKRKLWQFGGRCCRAWGGRVDSYQLGIMHKQVGSLL